MTLRQGSCLRKTKETDIELKVILAEEGFLKGNTGIEFLNHMLDLLTKHSGLQLELTVSGDLQVDFHHTVEDIGLCLGRALREALGDKRGIKRYSSLVLPMDEALVLCALDLSGRPGFYATLDFLTEKIGIFDSQLVEVFWRAVTQEAKMTLHLQQLAGENSHHLAEAVFKGVGRVLREALSLEGDELPSSKGIL